MRRREFIALFSSAATAWPLAAHAQQSDVPLIGVLLAQVESDLIYQRRLAAFREVLQKLGWVDGRNMRIEVRFGAGDSDRMAAVAAELVKTKPDVLFAGSSTPLAHLQQATRTIPIVFAGVSDPIGNNFVASFAHPGGNITGFASTEVSTAVKLVELLKQTAPQVARTALLYDPGFPGGERLVSSAEAAASILRVQLSGIAVRNTDEITSAIETLTRQPDGGLLMIPSPAVGRNLDLIVSLAARYRLPAVSSYREYTTAGLLASYGIDNVELYRSAASYVDRILKGEKPGDLPVQLSTKFELVINLKTAKLLGIEVPVAVLARTDEVIE
jgi:putative ABC transport system substrate-binding protein